MTHASCPDCRLRFRPATAAYLHRCPTCDKPLKALDGLDAAVGFRLFRPEEDPHTLPLAVAVSMPVPDGHRLQSQWE